MELKDLVRIDFEPLENHAMLISEFAEVYEYKDNKKTEKVRGYKAEFVIADGEAKGLRFNVEFPVLPVGAELMKQYVIDFDKDASSVYTQKGKFGVQFKLVAHELIAE